MNTLQSHWEAYARNVVPGSATPGQVHGSLIAFYSGADALRTLMQVAMRKGNGDARTHLLESFEQELAAFRAHPPAPGSTEAPSPVMDAAERNAHHARERALARVQRERLRQIHAEGWTEAHDDHHHPGTLARAAACYAISAANTITHGALLPALQRVIMAIWPWSRAWWKPSNTAPPGARDLVKAGALIIAELERLERAGLLPDIDKP